MRAPAPRDVGPGILRSVRRVLGRVAVLGVLAGDSDLQRLQKSALTLASLVVAILAFIWVGVYLALELPVSAAIPFGYQVAVGVGLIAFARTGNYERFRFGNTALMMILPFLLQWSLGGYVASSAVSLWALIAAIGALFFYDAREARPWFGAFAALTAISGCDRPVPVAFSGGDPRLDRRRVLRAQHPGRVADGVSPAPVRGPRAGSGAGTLGGPPAQRPPGVDRATTEAIGESRSSIGSTPSPCCSPTSRASRRSRSEPGPRRW